MKNTQPVAKTEDSKKTSAPPSVVEKFTFGHFLYLPAGNHVILQDGPAGKQPLHEVIVDPEGAIALDQQRKVIEAIHDRRAFFDFDQKGDVASFYPSRFVWQSRPTPGVWVSGYWTAAGRAAIEGGEFKGFSASFHIDGECPSHVVCVPDALPAFGGLVKEPQLKQLLWRKFNEPFDGWKSQ